MISFGKFALAAACIATLSMSLPLGAEAARLGGGRSFGSAPVMSRPVMPSQGSFGSGGSFGGASTMNRQAVPGAGAGLGRGGTGAMAVPSSGGMFSGFFGGMLAGTFLGHLFGGSAAAPAGGTAAAGTGSAGGFMNILLLVLLGWLGFRFIRRMTGGGAGTARRPSGMFRNEERESAIGGAGGAWDALRGRAAAGAGAACATEDGVSVPSDFDTGEFMQGAKAAYSRMQSSWDRRDLDDIAQFATEDVMNELRRQAADDPGPGRTEIMLVNAKLLEVRDEGPVRRAAVYFDVLMREDASASRPEQVREVWHFVCSRTGGDHWKLDGIQQMA